MFRKYPAFYLLIFVVSGILVADFSRFPAWFFILSAAIFCSIGFLKLNFKNSLIKVILFGLAIFSVSAFHFAIKHYDTGINHISNFVDSSKRYQIFGQVSDWPNLKTNRVEIKLSVDSLKSDKTFYVSGEILIKLAVNSTAIQRGDYLEFWGRIYPVTAKVKSGGFDYNRYLNLKNVFGVTYLTTFFDVRIDKSHRFGVLKIVKDIRDYIRDCFYKNLSKNSAALASGFLIGETRDIPPEIYLKFRDTGTLHLLAVSGSNVALVIIFVILLLRPFPISRKKRAVVLLGVIFIFNMLSYGEPSVLRASVMASLVIIAGVIQRRYNLNNIVASAALVILLWNPSQLFDVGFQLSFVIAWGLIFSLPPIVTLFERHKNRLWYRWLVFPFLISLVAQIYSLGLVSFYFNQIPIISPLANLFIVPLVSVAVIGILALITLSFIHPLLGSMVGSWLNLLLELTLKLVNFFGNESIPLLKFSDMSGILVVILYALIIMSVIAFSKIKIRRLVLFSVLVLLNVMMIAKVFTSDFDKNNVVISLFNIPGGIVSVHQLPNSSSADLVITGVTAKKYSIDELIIMPKLEKLSVKSIGKIFIFSADYNALDDIIRVAEKYSAKKIYVDKKLDKSIHDIVLNFTSYSDNVSIETYNNSLADLSGNGYYPSGQGLIYRYDNYEILLSHKIVPETLKPFQTKTNRTLAIGSSWSLKVEDMFKLQNIGFERIYCSKIEQPFLDSLKIIEQVSGISVSPSIINLYDYDLFTIKFPVIQ